MVRQAGWALGTALVTLVSEVEASTARVSFTAPEGCATKSGFWQAFSARAGRTRPSPNGEWQLEVTVRARAGRFDGALTIRRGTWSETRTLSDTSCADVATALAVIAALRIEPEDGTATEEAKALPPEPASIAAPQLVSKAAWHFRAGGAVTSTSYLARELSVGGLAFLELGHEGRSLLSPSARLGIHYASGGSVDYGQSGASLSSWLARVELSLLRIPIGFGFDGYLALVTEVGAIVGDGYGVDHAERHAAFFVDVGALLRVRWERSFVFAEASLGAVGIPTHVRFEFQPGPVVLFEVPWGGGVGQVGAGVRFF